jgi:hypothetical protein
MQFIKYLRGLILELIENQLLGGIAATPNENQIYDNYRFKIINKIIA